MLSVEQVHRSYGDKILFSDVSCTILDQDRIGLVGVNGTGKTTFLKTIAGIEKPESGTIKHAGDYRIEYLEQMPVLDDTLTVIEQIYQGDSDIMKAMRGYEAALHQLDGDPENMDFQEELMRAQARMDEVGAWEANTEAKTILSKLGISDYHRFITALSGGQQKRVALAKALIQPADLLLLDEPTNHLDNHTVEWLEKYLASYEGALLLVTHDRYFLNRVTNQIYELDNGNLYIYEGNYEHFLEKKSEREALERSEEEKHKNLLKQELAWLNRSPQARGTKQKARVERAREMQQKTFHTEKESVSIKTGSRRLGKQVLELEEVGKSFADRNIIYNLDFLLTPGDRVGIIGPNGSGKTTLLDIMAGRIETDEGEKTIGQTVRIGYYTQGDEELDGDLRINEYIKQTAEVITGKDGTIITAEQMLERFLFPRKQQWTYIRSLSGGEKRRLYLLKILMEAPNLLLLDEPTNDLDIQTLGVLESYLEDFPGVVVAVSHDRYFLDRVADRLLVFHDNGEITHFHGNYADYRKKESHTTVSSGKTKDTSKKDVPGKQQHSKKKLSYQEKKEWETIEGEITDLESSIETLQQQITEAGSDTERVQELFSRQQEEESLLEWKMERWEELSLRMEEENKND